VRRPAQHTHGEISDACPPDAQAARQSGELDRAYDPTHIGLDVFWHGGARAENHVAFVLSADGLSGLANSAAHLCRLFPSLMSIAHVKSFSNTVQNLQSANSDLTYDT
jgi:hypothetical protein